MKCSDIVWIRTINKEGILMSFAIDECGEKKCVVYVEKDNHYIVSESNLEFIETLEDSLTHSLDRNFKGDA